ncbi:MAG: aminotransferase class III-fold pyridoxal phosphate-dependent enzyme [Gemmatimonadaceae bacterium]|jgi:glutamate-1-semialdehyde 2,1-aminomutase|nr:aminotransferase class III-fold pyridoxal phosphate-dependent enzyme [Gemmatimonadaceae bacterium]
MREPLHDLLLDADWRAVAEELIPGGASTGSKRAAALLGADAQGPTHFVRADGCVVETASGRTLIDCTMALGAVAIGYADRDITHAVIAAVRDGTVSGLSPLKEVQLAEHLIDMIPCAEQVRFLKTGAEAGAAAVRLARAATGRAHVIACGYFGWLDWSSDEAGVPASTRVLCHRIPFDDVAALDATVREVEAQPDGLAAIIVEPIVEVLARPEWFAAIRAHCDRTGAVFIVDEVKTGFRVRPGGVHDLLQFTPDLAVFGKAMANGFPLAAVVGRQAIMEVAARTWISSTLASETASLAAALAVLAWHDRMDVCTRLEHIGRDLQHQVARALREAGATDLAIRGVPQMWGLSGPATRIDALVTRAIEHGVLLKRGYYHFAALAHDPSHLSTIGDAVHTAARAVGPA